MKSSINTAPPKQSGVPAVRCAIYTRKSSEQGLEQEFNSLHAQRESAEAYIASMKKVSTWNSTASMRSARPARPM